MSYEKSIKKAFIKKRVSELKARKFSFQINKIILPNGHEGEYGSIIHPGAALAVPLTKDGKVIILRQYRFAVSRYLLEFPAGTLEIGETPLNTIKREIQEETGYSAKRWDELGVLVPAPGYADEEIHLFLARELTKLEEIPIGDLDEDIQVLSLDPLELDDLIASGKEVLDGKTVTAWFRTKQLLNL
ncbi:MAG: NUDIX hydrolase [Prochlorococcus sp. SP3034]|nr:NUDIX hydrolase [Prochlorococcus sp. SP3034]|tara:strand:- start:32 stop:592 length:561 start_codon:yes stop_codon:yes gene_type:complete